MSSFRKEVVSRRHHVPVLAAAVLGWTALMAALYWPVDPVYLAKHEGQVYSQFGEDGVLEKIFELVPPGPRFAVEFGSGDGVSLSNSRNLILNHGFGALLIEGDEDLAAYGAEAYANFPRVESLHAWVYPGNVEILFEEHGVPTDLDLLSIDIDSNDYYVWRAITEFRPKVVLIEYNPGFPPPSKRVVEFSPFNYWDGSDYYGASIQSLYELGKKKGYELVHVESHGANLFFVAAEYYPRFGLADNSPSLLYRLPTYGVQGAGRAPNGLGWPAWDIYTEPGEDGSLVKPHAGDLHWDAFDVPKKWTER